MGSWARGFIVVMGQIVAWFTWLASVYNILEWVNTFLCVVLKFGVVLKFDVG